MDDELVFLDGIITAEDVGESGGGRSYSDKKQEETRDMVKEEGAPSAMKQEEIICWAPVATPCLVLALRIGADHRTRLRPADRRIIGSADPWAHRTSSC